MRADFSSTFVSQNDSNMETVAIIGYLSAIIIGISLGLIGGGGSILTVPAMVYLLHVNPMLATAYSLFVVGATSLAGSFSFMKKGLVDYKTALVFATPSFIALSFTTPSFTISSAFSSGFLILSLMDFVFSRSENEICSV